MNKKGFTLLELLIVIGILAVLATTTLLVLNPAELLRQARDSQRVSDLGSLNSALSLYATTVTTPYLGASNAASTTAYGSCVGNGSTTEGCFVSINGVSGGTMCDQRTTSTPIATVSTTNDIYSRNVTGRPYDSAIAYSGPWLPVDFSDITGGSPLQTLPQDPATSTGNGGRYYSYMCDQRNIQYELNAVFESAKYRGVYDAADGGSSSTVYEIGTAPALALPGLP